MKNKKKSTNWINLKSNVNESYLYENLIYLLKNKNELKNVLNASECTSNCTGSCRGKVLENK